MKNLYSSPFSTIDYEPANRLLLACWTQASSKLDEDGVKSEISRILGFVKEYGIQRIIVDTRLYVFRENHAIQQWINRQFMPAVMEGSVVKYAIIVDEKFSISHALEDWPDSEELVVEYFKDPAEARQWIESSSLPPPR